MQYLNPENNGNFKGNSTSYAMRNKITKKVKECSPPEETAICIQIVLCE